LRRRTFRTYDQRAFSTPGLHAATVPVVALPAIALRCRKEARMLILTRRPVETIYIGDEVTVTVLGVVGNQVRFGIEAPRHIVIDRAEIHERKKRAALANGNPGNAHGNVNGNVLEEEEAIAGHEGDRQNGNVETLKLRR
jgi:carbon storage regulator